MHSTQPIYHAVFTTTQPSRNAHHNLPLSSMFSRPLILLHHRPALRLDNRAQIKYRQIRNRQLHDRNNQRQEEIVPQHRRREEACPHARRQLCPERRVASCEMEEGAGSETESDGHEEEDEDEDAVDAEGAEEEDEGEEGHCDEVEGWKGGVSVSEVMKGV